MVSPYLWNWILPRISVAEDEFWVMQLLAINYTRFELLTITSSQIANCQNA